MIKQPALKKKEIGIETSNSEKITKKNLNKWDKHLDDYANYIKEYIKHYKKSLKGNSASVPKYLNMKSKFEDLNTKLNQAQSNQLLTHKQIKRELKIQMKIIHAFND